MGEAFGWGFIAASSLLLGALLALRRPIGLRPLGLVMAFGAGVLISAVAYELVEDAFGTAGGSGAVGPGLFAGALAFYSLGTSPLIVLAGREGRVQRGPRTKVQPSPSCWAPSWTGYPSRWCSAYLCWGARG
jgi:drug/metabolite transporter (DMT)-like permease